MPIFIGVLFKFRQHCDLQSSHFQKTWLRFLKQIFFGLCFLNQNNWEKYCFPADTNPKRSGLPLTQESIPFPTVGCCHLQQCAISSSYSELRSHWHLLGVHSREQKSPSPTGATPALWPAPANTRPDEPQQTAVPLPTRASRTWYTCPCLTQHNFCKVILDNFRAWRAPSRPLDKLAWHQTLAGLSSSHCHLGIFPLAIKALGPCRTTIKSQGTSATELLRIWINPHILLDFVTLLAAIVSSKPCNC